MILAKSNFLNFTVFCRFHLLGEFDEGKKSAGNVLMDTTVGEGSLNLNPCVFRKLLVQLPRCPIVAILQLLCISLHHCCEPNLGRSCQN
ncbi:hypothetical protein M0R45_012013 [Rubus argutus]|uniref:Uncharacterized protein n=1 Tax=Rubus argutus TaxID=59490 RepID=A0AAW1YBW3_RUBAR